MEMLLLQPANSTTEMARIAVLIVPFASFELPRQPTTEAYRFSLRCRLRLSPRPLAVGKAPYWFRWISAALICASISGNEVSKLLVRCS